MKKTKLLLALIISFVMCFVPAYALTLDMAEATSVILAEEALLAADPGIETTHELYGDLLFYEDFEDQSTSSWYGEDAKNAYVQSTVQDLIVESPDGNGYVADFEYYNTFFVTMKEKTVYDELTFVADVYGKPNTTLNKVGYFNGTWYDQKSTVSKPEVWTTVMYTTHNVTLENTPTLALNGTTNFYVDNIRVYGKKIKTEGVFASKPAECIPTYGNLVYFDNFSGNTGFTNTADVVISGLSDTTVIKDGYRAVLAHSTCPDLPTNVRGITVSSGENGWAYTDGTPMKGTLSIYGEQYVLNNSGAYSVINKDAASSLQYPWGWTSTMYVGNSNRTASPENFKWTSGYSHTQKLSDTVTKFGYSATKTDTLWAFRSVAVYFMPETKVTLSVDGKTEYVDLYGKVEYTLPEIDTEGTYYTAWVDGDGTRYEAGTKLAVADVKDKTFTALTVTVPLLDENLGELAIFHGFEGSDYTQIEYFSENVFENVTFSQGDGLAFNTFAQVEDYDDSSNKALEMTLKDGASWTISGFQYTLDKYNFVPEEGIYSQLIDVYNRNEGSALSRDSIYSTAVETGFGVWNAWKDITFTPGEWTKNVAFYPLYAKKNTNPETAEAQPYVFGWGDDTYQKSNYNELRYIQHRFTGSGKTSVTVDNYRLYFYPANAFMVKDGAALVMERGAEDGTYTFKAPSEVLGGEYGANVCYTDGTAKYFAGQTVDISKIAGRTLTLDEAVPVNSGDAEIRVSAAVQKTGIRFKASITPSLKAVSSEYGFILAREDVLESLDAELTFGLNKEGLANGEGVLFVRGVAYKTDENGNVVTDKIYSDNEDGSVNFTGVAVGFDISVKKQVTTKLTARPYVIIKNANGNEFVAYGESYSESLAGVAQVLKDAADGENADALDAYKSADYEGGNFIDDILASAGN